MSNKKQQLFDELIDEVRMSQNATDRFDHAVANALGVNRTDMRCIDVLERVGPLTAGRLAAATGLTTGATTTAIDRLERAAFARRVPDSADRRRVLVQLTPEALERGRGFYTEHAKLAQRLYRRYSEHELKLLLEYVRAGRELNEREAARLEAQRFNRAAGSRSRGVGRGSSGG
jgi:DNA-binding MarR family transcriptional regulator